MKFDPDESAEAWIRRQPIDVAIVVAFRWALCVVHVVANNFASASDEGGEDEVLEELINAFCAAALSRAIVLFPGQSDVFYRSCGERGYTEGRAVYYSDQYEGNAHKVENGVGYFSRYHVPAARAAASAAVSWAVAAALADDAASVTKFSFEALKQADSAAFHSNMTSVVPATEADARFIANGGASKDLATHPLWPDDAFLPAREQLLGRWNELKSALPTDQDWDVWINWYEDRLAGRVHSEEYELVFASIPNEVWEQGPAAANRWIKDHLPKEEQPLPAMPFPEQGGLGSRFTEHGAGPIDLASDPPEGDPEKTPLHEIHYEEARLKLTVILALDGNTLNAGDAVIVASKRISEVMPEQLAGVFSVVRIWHRVHSLRRLLENHRAADVRRSRDPKADPDLALMTYAVAAPVEDFLTSCEAFFETDVEAKKLEQGRLTAEERARADAALRNIAPIIEALSSLPKIATVRAAEELAEQLVKAQNAPKNASGNQDVALAQNSSLNAVIAMLRKVGGAVEKEGDFAAKEFRSGAYKEAGKLVFDHALENAPDIARFISQNAEQLKQFAMGFADNQTIIAAINVIKGLF